MQSCWGENLWRERSPSELAGPGISEALNLGKVDCYADDSFLIFEGEPWDEVCKMASEETTNVMVWLQDIGMWKKV